MRIVFILPFLALSSVSSLPALADEDPGFLEPAAACNAQAKAEQLARSLRGAFVNNVEVAGDTASIHIIQETGGPRPSDPVQRVCNRRYVLNLKTCRVGRPTVDCHQAN